MGMCLENTYTYDAESLLEAFLGLQLEFLDLGLLFSHLPHFKGEVSLCQGSSLHHEGSLRLSHEHDIEGGGPEEHLRALYGEKAAHGCSEGNAVLSCGHVESASGSVAKGDRALSQEGERLLAELPLSSCCESRKHFNVYIIYSSISY